jgi:hypothetical protein
MSAAQLDRVRRICAELPGSEERVSHGEPTFFVKNKVYVMFANNHHNDGHVAVWVPTPPGAQAATLSSDPATYFRPPYVGARGWVGIELARASDEALRFHIQVAYDLSAAPRRTARRPR